MDVFVVMSDRSKELGHVMVMQRVEDVAPIAVRANQAQRPEDPQMMRRRTGGESGALGELLHRARSIDQRHQHPQTPRRAQRLQRLGELFGFLTVKRPVRGGVFGPIRHFDLL